MPDAEHLLNFLQSALLQAGEVSLRFHGRNPRHWNKPDGSVVTEGDLAVNESLLTAITKAMPGDAILSEETPDSSKRLTNSRLWIIDPVDGTRNYLSGGTDWCIGVALVENGVPTLSAIYQPTERRMYHALKGTGAFCNNQRLTASPSARNVIAPKSMHPAIAASGLVPQASGSLALLLRFAAIAEGRLAGTVSTGNKKDWDIAAGHLLLLEAGGAVSRLAGGNIVYNQPDPWQPGLIAATAATHAKIIEAVAEI